MTAFHRVRRQQFLTEEYFVSNDRYFQEERDHWACALSAAGDTEEERRMLARSTHASFAYNLLSLRYTSGAPIESLRVELGRVVEAYECFKVALATYENIPEVAPLGMGNIGDYERCLQLVGLCYLLHRRDLLPRLVALQDPAYRGADALYEDLLRYGLEQRPETDELLHFDPYDLLLGAIWAQSDEESLTLLNEYVESWYPAFKYVPWHDGHLRINGTDGDYFGYWAFEAGAVAYLCNIDDSAVTHMVYPKDLVDWARSHAHLSGTTAQERQLNRLRCEAGQPCLKDGEWETPAQTNSRRRFKQGEIMPSLGTDYGQTIWHWVEA